MNKTNTTLIVSVVLLLAAGLLAPMWMGMAMDGMMSGMVAAWIPMLGFWLVIAIGFMMLLRAIDGRRRGGHEAPLDIAKRRYAAGEISRDEYDRLRKDLEH